MANWTAPKINWQVNEIVTADAMNAIGDNLLYLKQLSGRKQQTFSATSTTNTSIFSSVTTLSVTTRGGDLLVGALASATHSAGSAGTGIGYFDVAVNGVRLALGGNEGSLKIAVGGLTGVPFSVLVDQLDAGTHTIAWVWRTNSGTLSLTNGRLWVVEV